MKRKKAALSRLVQFYLSIHIYLGPRWFYTARMNFLPPLCFIEGQRGSRAFLSFLISLTPLYSIPLCVLDNNGSTNFFFCFCSLLFVLKRVTLGRMRLQIADCGRRERGQSDREYDGSPPPFRVCNIIHSLFNPNTLHIHVLPVFYYYCLRFINNVLICMRDTIQNSCEWARSKKSALRSLPGRSSRL